MIQQFAYIKWGAHANGSPTDQHTTLLANGGIANPYFGPAVIEPGDLKLKRYQQGSLYLEFNMEAHGHFTNVTLDEVKLDCSFGIGRDGSCHRVILDASTKELVRDWMSKHHQEKAEPFHSFDMSDGNVRVELMANGSINITGQCDSYFDRIQVEVDGNTSTVKAKKITPIGMSIQVEINLVHASVEVLSDDDVVAELYRELDEHDQTRLTDWIIAFLEEKEVAK